MNAAVEGISMVMKKVDAIGKTRRNTQQGFNFRSIEDVYQHLQLAMASVGLVVIPTHTGILREERTTNKGGIMNTSVVAVEYLIMRDGDKVQAAAHGEGMDSGDKATAKAMTMAHKTLLLQLFMIPTEDAIDPDKESPELGDRPLVTNVEIGIMQELMKQTGTDEGDFLTYLEVQKLEALTLHDYKIKALPALNFKAAKMEKKK